MCDILGKRTDLYCEKMALNYDLSDNISIYESDEDDIYHTITFSHLVKEDDLIEVLKNELLFFIEKLGLLSPFKVLVVGLGSDGYTADSTGPKVLKGLNVNAHLAHLGIRDFPIEVASIEPGVMGETGIETRRIVESIVEEIKPELVVLVDSIVIENPKFLNRSIELSDRGVTPGSGIKGINGEISKKTLKVPVLSIGVPTAIEIEIQSKNYIVSTSNVDEYVRFISKVVAKSLNRTFDHLVTKTVLG